MIFKTKKSEMGEKLLSTEECESKHVEGMIECKITTLKHIKELIQAKASKHAKANGKKVIEE